MTKIATIQLLLIEDNLGDARLLREMLNEPQSRHIKLTHAECMRDAENLITDQVFDVVLLDPGLPDTQGLDSIRRAKATAQNVPLVVLTGHDDDELASLALHEGAQDYLVKNEITPRGLQRALRYAIERQIMKESLFIEKERAQVTLNCIGDAVISTDDSRNVTFLNSVAEQLTGWSQKDAQGRHITEVAQIIYETSVERLSNLIGMEEGKSPAFSFPNSVLIRRDGVSISIEESVAPIHDREGQRSGSVIIFRDVSAARALSLQIIHSAEHDFLTDLPNRMLFIDRVSQAIAMATRQTRQIAILFLDLDGFKHINDSLGHSIGDQLLKSVSKRLVGCARVTDTVSRQGGDEFVVLLSEVDEAEDAALAARRMLEEVSKPHIIEQHTLDITTSIGISIYPDDGRDAETLIKNADTAMYQAKEDGRRGFKFFKSAMNVRAVERQSIEQDLRHALDRQEFSLHYQPKIDLKTGAITGAEALLRWTHPTRGPVSPETFISIAEDCGLIVPIGNWVLREACSQTVSWLAAGLPSISIAVNVSALQFRHENFAKNLFTILSDTGMDPRSLEIELTESVLMKHADTAADILRNLRDSGIRIAIDDFGTGYSSLSYLQRFPVDTLKIDQSFVRQITTVGADTAIVSAVLSMARILEMRVVAEGVETVEALTFLQSQRCDEAQGYYFSRPVIASQFATLLSTGIPKALGLRGDSGIGIGRSKSKPDTPWRDLLANAGGNSHIVQLYQDDESCGDAISHFAAEGIIRGDSIILVHTKPHWEIISHRLSSRGFEIDELIRQGQLTLLDARDTLSKFMAGTDVKADTFKSLAKKTITKARAGGVYPHVRWSGEMVNLLYKNENFEGSIRLAELLGEVGREESTAVFNSFHMDKYDPEIYEGVFDQICRTHTHVIPTGDDIRQSLCVRQAIAEIAGETEEPQRNSFDNWKGAPTQMPRSQALLLWINETIPNKFKAVLSRARELDIGFGMRERAQATKIAVNDVVKTPIK